MKTMPTGKAEEEEEEDVITDLHEAQDPAAMM